uniref:Uncharacterized protein n=1 Tax=Ditylenchus dipsaci TaxID=166011 RepID=A0A915DJP1_9BILA
MTSVFQKSNHQRQSSQVQQLIPKPDTANNYDHQFEESASPYSDVVECTSSSGSNRPVPVQQHKNNDDIHKGSTTTDSNAMRFSTLSDCSSYYGLPGTHTENETRYLCKNPYLRPIFE